jgi:hypothetical protein
VAFPPSASSPRIVHMPHAFKWELTRCNLADGGYLRTSRELARVTCDKCRRMAESLERKVKRDASSGS